MPRVVVPTDRPAIDEAQAAAAAGRRFIDDAEPVAFEEVLAPLVETARERLAARASPARLALLTERAHGDLERLLLRRLSGLSARSLHVAFTAERMARLTPFDRLLARTSDTPPRRAYDLFVARMAGGAFDQFLAEYSVLARLAARLSDQWVDAAAEFLERLAVDAAALEQAFGRGNALGCVVRVRPGLSDPHRGGRMAICVEFHGGVTVAYKPKDLGTECAFNRLLAWCNERGSLLAWRPLTVLARPGYGWVEWVVQAPCATEDDARDYYERAGMLVCLVYALAGIDCHRENVIAAGAHPVLVDTESLMHHLVVRSGGPPRAREHARDELVRGVLGTGLLPSWQVSDRATGTPATDVSALHTPAAEELVCSAPQWRAVNTDGMALARTTVNLPMPNSQPVLDGRPTRLDDYAGHVLAGFERFYQFLVEQRPALLAPGSPLHEMAAQPVRILFRDTRVYGALHWEICDASRLRDEDQRQQHLATLERALITPDDWAHWEPLVRAEQRALDEADIPLFLARADSLVLDLGAGQRLEGCLLESGAQLVMHRLGTLGPDDMEKQLGFVAGSLHANAAHRRTPQQRRRRADPAASRPPADVERANLEHAALAIASEMRASAICSSRDDSASWIAPQYLPQLDRYQLQPIGFDLHSGGCGIALFLAAVGRLTGADEHGRLARAALQPVRGAIETARGTLADELGTGAATGLGGVVYGLTHVARLLDDRALLEAAAAAAVLLTEERMMRAPADVFAGLAGEILGLLALHAAAPDDAVLGRAAACGRRLLELRAPTEGGRLAWITLKGRALSGFSHGAAGIAYALLRLYKATGSAPFREAAVDAIAYEDEMFDAGAGNWLDLREDEQPAFKSNWCHGAPGIGLARLGGLRALDTPRVRHDLEAAIAATLRLDGEGPDHLCCGTLGRVELLLTAGKQLRRPELADAARARVEAVVARATAEGGYTLHEFLPRHVYMPGLFMGLAGVGYGILRAARPTLLPSVLLFE